MTARASGTSTRPMSPSMVTLYVFNGSLAGPCRTALVVGDLTDPLAGEHLGMLSGLGDRLGIVGPARRQRHVAGLLDSVTQRSQLEGSSQSPCTETTGVAPEAFARSTCVASCSVMAISVVISSSLLFARGCNPLRTGKAKTKPAWRTLWAGVSDANHELRHRRP